MTATPNREMTATERLTHALLDRIQTLQRAYGAAAVPPPQRIEVAPEDQRAILRTLPEWKRAVADYEIAAGGQLKFAGVPVFVIRTAVPGKAQIVDWDGTATEVDL
jgi:hypothetical protein